MRLSSYKLANKATTVVCLVLALFVWISLFGTDSHKIFRKEGKLFVLFLYLIVTNISLKIRELMLTPFKGQSGY